MTITANVALAHDAETARRAVLAAEEALRFFTTRLQIQRYELAAPTSDSVAFRALWNDARTDLTALTAITRRLDRLKGLLAEQAEARFTAGQAQVRDALTSIAERSTISTQQADYFLELAARAFGPADPAQRVNTTAVFHALFDYDGDDRRVLRPDITIDSVRHAVLANVVPMVG